MKTKGETRTNEDACLYTRTYSDWSSIMLILYVDDMLRVGQNKDESIAALPIDELIEKADGFAGVFPGNDNFA